MGVVGEINRLAITSWAPAGIGGGYIASGTFAGAIDPSFQSGASLELLAVDIQNSRLTVATDCRTSEKFCSVTWGAPARAHPAGLIAGGLSDGTVRVWDAAALLRSPKSTDDEDKGVVFGGSSFQKKHEGSVRGLCFNPFVPTLLASGGADTKIFVWDLSNPNEGPSIRPPGAQQISTGNVMPSDEVTALAWNRRVQHILGSGTAAGVLHIWDLKQRRQVISIRNPNSRMRCSAIHWHPEIATQVLTTCDQDNGSGAILWDLRNATAPVMTFDQFASRGVASASWCPQDSEMIMLATREPRNVIVSPLTGEILCELQASQAPSFDVQWSPRIPGMYLSSSIDAMLTVKSLLSADASSSVSVDTANALAASFGEIATEFRSGLSVQSPRTQREERKAVSISRPPKWLRRPACVSFGPTGFFATSLAKDKSKVIVTPGPKSHDGLRDTVSGLDAILIDVPASDPSQAERLCRDAITDADNADDAMGFEVLCCLMQKNSRTKILKYLGYDVTDSNEVLDASADVYGILRSEPLANPVRTMPIVEAQSSFLTDTNAVGEPLPDSDSILSNKLSLSGPAPWDDDGTDTAQASSILDGDDSTFPSSNGLRSQEVPAPVMNGTSSSEFKGMSESAVDAAVRKALVVGNLEKAVSACLYAGRISDALVIAHAGGPKLWLTAQSHYLTSLGAEQDGNVLGAITGPLSKLNEFLREVNDKSKDSWKEALAIILTYVPGKDINESCSTLGQRLLLAGRKGAALVCFLCAGNTEMATSTWMQNRPATGNMAAATASRVQLLTSLVRKVRLITAATLLGMGDESIGTVRALDDVSGKVLCEFGGLLAVEGEFDLAVTYLCNLDPEVNGVYGCAGDIHAQVSAALSDVHSLHQPSGVTEEYSGSYGISDGGYGQLNAMGYSGGGYNAPMPSWNQGPALPRATVPPPMPSPMPAAQPIQNSYSKSVRTTDRSSYDPRSAYAGAPSYDNYPAPVQTGMMPPVQPPPLGPPQALHGPSASMPPPAPMVPVPPMANTATGNYSTMTPMQPVQPMMPTMPPGNLQAQAFQPPPPPPPPTDEAMPTPYHAKAKPGSGITLPPSAEIAVAASRKPLSVSSTPGGPPKRSHSSSSSLSSMAGNEPVTFLDKADVGSVPASQQVIVKSLRGAYSYALKRNNAMMYRKKMEDVNKKLGRLVSALNKGAVDPEIVPLLLEIGKFIEKGNYDSASGVVVTLTRQHWDNNSQWIQALKRLIDCVLTGR